MMRLVESILPQPLEICSTRVCCPRSTSPTAWAQDDPQSQFLLRDIPGKRNDENDGDIGDSKASNGGGQKWDPAQWIIPNESYTLHQNRSTSGCCTSSEDTSSVNEKSLWLTNWESGSNLKLQQVEPESRGKGCWGGPPSRVWGCKIRAWGRNQKWPRGQKQVKIFHHLAQRQNGECIDKKSHLIMEDQVTLESESKTDESVYVESEEEKRTNIARAAARWCRGPNWPHAVVIPALTAQSWDHGLSMWRSHECCAKAAIAANRSQAGVAWHAAQTRSRKTVEDTVRRLEHDLSTQQAENKLITANAKTARKTGIKIREQDSHIQRLQNQLEKKTADATRREEELMSEKNLRVLLRKIKFSSSLESLLCQEGCQEQQSGCAGLQTELIKQQQQHSEHTTSWNAGKRTTTCKYNMCQTECCLKHMALS